MQSLQCEFAVLRHLFRPNSVYLLGENNKVFIVFMLIASTRSPNCRPSTNRLLIGPRALRKAGYRFGAYNPILDRQQ